MTSEEKAIVINAFRNGTTPALVCTVVVEVSYGALPRGGL
jgi:RecG-like helicase